MNSLFFLPQDSFERCFTADAQHRIAVWAAIRPPQEKPAWEEQCGDVEILITGWGSPKISAAMLDAAPRLKMIFHAAGSAKSLLPPDFWNRNLRLSTCRTALAVSVAETTLGLILTGLKGVFPAAHQTRQGFWKTPANTLQGYPAREMHGMTIGIIGASAVGRELLRLLALFNVKILLSDPYVSEEQAAALGARKASLDMLLSYSDVVTLHAAALPETRHMIGAAELKRMKNDAILINTARGMLIDEAALIAELQTGRIHAFLDVTEEEPPAKNHPFRTLDNVVLTPHLAGPISNGCALIGDLVATQLEAFAQGTAIPGEILQTDFVTMA